MPLRPALEFQQEYQIRQSIRCPDPPGHVGVAPPQLLVNELRGQWLEGRVVDPVSPFGDVPADEERYHPRVGEELLECGVVHRAQCRNELAPAGCGAIIIAEETGR